MECVELSGKSEGKGRNGYFRLHGAEVMRMPSDPDGQVLHFDFHPKRRVKSIGPARLLLTIEDAAKLGIFFTEAAESERRLANIDEGELVCNCGHRGTPRLKETGYGVSHELVEIAGNTITARGWDGSAAGISEEGDAYWLMCAACGKRFALPPELIIEWM
jgi:hypothetical protein